MKRYKRKGRVDITDLNTPPEKHELATAKFFAKMGKNIKKLMVVTKQHRRLLILK